MPIYEYLCTDCGHAYSELIRAGEAPTCPSCASHRGEKQLSVFATRTAAPPRPEPGACGTCGDPRGPGSCSN